MSSIKLKGSTSGDITISAPAVAGTNTLTLPAKTGTVQTTSDIEVDMFRLTSPTSDGANADITANLERCDDASFSKIGTGMTESSGIFSFPRTGVYEVKVQALVDVRSGDGTAEVQTKVTINNSDYDITSVAIGGDDSGTNGVQITGYGQCFVNVTDTSNVKVRFTSSVSVDATSTAGASSYSRTHFSFIRLGDT